MALFYPRDSYIDPEDDAEYCVTYAQLRFDYTEIRARKFFREAMASQESDEDTGTRLRRLYRELNSQFLRQLDEIDADLQENPGHMASWQGQARQALTSLQAYADKTGTLR